MVYQKTFLRHLESIDHHQTKMNGDGGCLTIVSCQAESPITIAALPTAIRLGWKPQGESQVGILSVCNLIQLPKKLDAALSIL